MRLAPQYEFSEEQDKALKKARLSEYISLAYLVSVIYLMYIVMGSSQAMKTAWIEDCLSLIPPICFLFSSYVCWRKPTKHYPFGFHRVTSILFLCAALALFIMGGFLFIESALKLLYREHPTIGLKSFFGQDIWLGWWMILVLLWGTFPPVILGGFKLKYSKVLNDKILFTDGKMNKADWMTAVAAIGGVLGIGMGWWWADALAAMIISLDILKDGWSQTAEAVTGLINRAPKSVGGGYIDLPDKIQLKLIAYDWVEEAQVRLYESGHLINGEGFIRVKDQKAIDPNKFRNAIAEICDMDWRLREFALSLIPEEKKTSS